MKKGYLTLLVLLMFAMVVAYFVTLQQSDQPTPEQHVLEEYGKQLASSTPNRVITLFAVVQISLSRFMVYYASMQRRYPLWLVYGSPICRPAPRSSWI